MERGKGGERPVWFQYRLRVMGVFSVRRKSIAPAAIGTFALLAGLGIMVALIAMRRPPAGATVQVTENAMHVEALRVVPRDVPVTIVGYGQVNVLKTVEVAPEVSGKVVSIHPNLVAGGIIPKGETLFEIDAEPYRAQVTDVEATVTQLEATIARLRKEQKNEQERLESLQRARDIAEAQFERLKELIAEDVGTETGVDAAEAAYVTTRDEVDQLNHELDLYPNRIREAQGTLESAQAKRELARISLGKTRVVAPFDARVKQRSVEKDQFLNAGMDVLELADDSILEIRVPLDSRDARRWLQFREGRPGGSMAWFSDPDPVECAVLWTEDENGASWAGILDRVESFDETSRTLTVAIRIDGRTATGPDRLPLVEGMFCRVEIPGRVMKSVFAIPQSAVTIANTVFTSADNRLKTAPIDVARLQGPFAYVSGGLESGDLVITTRLVNPLDHTLLNVTVVSEATP